MVCAMKLCKTSKGLLFQSLSCLLNMNEHYIIYFCSTAKSYIFKGILYTFRCILAVYKYNVEIANEICESSYRNISGFIYIMCYTVVEHMLNKKN